MDDRTYKEKEIDRRAMHSLDAIRERQQEKAKADREKLQTSVMLAREKLDTQAERDQANFNRKEYLQRQSIQARERALMQRSEENQEKREHLEELTVARAESGIELERLRYQLRELERLPNFEDHKMREELAFLIRRQERLDENKIANYDLERRITEIRSRSREDIYKTVLLAVIEHLQSENTHERTLEELQESTSNEVFRAERETDNEVFRARKETENELLKAEQAHGHRVKEMFSARYLDLIFSQMGGQLGGLSRTEVDDLVNQWEKEGDRLKK